MAHFAEIDENNVVVRVLVTDNDDPNGDEGYQWLLDNLGGTWVQTSYTSRGGNRINPDTGEIVSYNDHFRFNYAGIGFTYDAELDAFIPPKPFDSWTIDETTALWVAPVAYPSDGKLYAWDENAQTWNEVITGE